MKKTLATIQLTSLFISSILFIIITIPFKFSIYEKFYKTNNYAQSLKIKHEKLLEHTKNLLNYIKTGKTLDSNWFTKKDILHMIDVRDLYLITQKTIMIFFIIFLITTTILIFLERENTLKLISSSFNKVLYIFISILMFLISLIIYNFNYFWIKFHELIFSNDLWLLSPDESNLIKMFPEKFFYELVLKIILTIIIFFIIISILNKKIKKNLK